jgi:methylated-DNA-protein-cysteine methyltransferase-like protein
MRYIPDDHQQYFYQQVWQQARQIPYAKVATYGQIAQSIPAPQGIQAADYKAYSARWVGDAMAACPSNVPWQRVINAQGKVSKRVDAQKQKALLEAEGIAFTEDKLDMRLHQYNIAAKQAEPDIEKPIQSALF